MSILALKDISYHYEDSTQEVLHHITSEFEKGVLYTIDLFLIYQTLYQKIAFLL